jgi:hypothetical protein
VDAADVKRQLYLRQLCQQIVKPQVRAFAVRWKVATVSSPWIAIYQRGDRDFRRLIKPSRLDICLSAQSVATGVSPRCSRSVYARLQRLPNNQIA